MKMNDIKILWGRAANRCAFPDCTVELSPARSTDVLGEIAHIIAKSPDGPRGDNKLPLEERDNYDNLILLCPTHHRIIDTNPKEWTVEKVNNLKQGHEEWITTQLEQGQITTHEIDNSEFLDNCKNKWLTFSGDYVWIILSITPLDISGDIVNVLEPEVLDALNNLTLPEDIHVSNYSTVDQYYTRPNEYGVINEDLSNIIDGIGHRIQICRNGHIEFCICLEKSTRQITEAARSRHREEVVDIKILRYTDIATCFIKQVNGIKSIWDAVLPVNDMLLTGLISNTNSTRLFSREGRYNEDVIGHTIHSDILEYSNIFNKKSDINEMNESIIKRFVNYFGLIIDDIYDEKYKLIRPRSLY